MALLAAATPAACGDAPEEESSEAPRAGAAASDFLPCIVSDAGGFDDKSFNQLGHEGAKQAADELGVELNDVESNSENDYGPNLESLVAEGCNAIVTVGFALVRDHQGVGHRQPRHQVRPHRRRAPTAATTARPSTARPTPNIKPLLYDTAQAAFLAGYAAADYTKTGTVGTYGGSRSRP